MHYYVQLYDETIRTERHGLRAQSIRSTCARFSGFRNEFIVLVDVNNFHIILDNFLCRERFSVTKRCYRGGAFLSGCRMLRCFAVRRIEWKGERMGFPCGRIGTFARPHEIVVNERCETMQIVVSILLKRRESHMLRLYVGGENVVAEKFAVHVERRSKMG